MSRACVGLILTAVLAWPAASDAAKAPKPGAKLDGAVAQAMTEGADRVPVIVRTTKGKLARLLEKLRNSGTVATPLPAIDALAIEASGPDIVSLASERDVQSVSLDAPIMASAADPLDTFGQPMTMTAVRATLGLAGHSGQGTGIGVAVIDSGMDESDGLRGPIVAAFVIDRGAVKATAPQDGYGHGTHVAGLIAADPLYTKGEFAGLAPGVRLVQFKVLASPRRPQTPAWSSETGRSGPLRGA